MEGGKIEDINIENKLRFLEDQIIILKRNNASLAKILIEKVKPVCDEWYSKRMNEDGGDIDGYA